MHIPRFLGSGGVLLGHWQLSPGLTSVLCHLAALKDGDFLLGTASGRPDTIRQELAGALKEQLNAARMEAAEQAKALEKATAEAVPQGAALESPRKRFWKPATRSVRQEPERRSYGSNSPPSRSNARLQARIPAARSTIGGRPVWAAHGGLGIGWVMTGSPWRRF